MIDQLKSTSCTPPGRSEERDLSSLTGQRESRILRLATGREIGGNFTIRIHAPRALTRGPVYLLGWRKRFAFWEFPYCLLRRPSLRAGSGGGAYNEWESGGIVCTVVEPGRALADLRRKRSFRCAAGARGYKQSGTFGRERARRDEGLGTIKGIENSALEAIGGLGRAG